MGFFFKRLKNDFEIAVVNEPSVLEPRTEGLLYILIQPPRLLNFFMLTLDEHEIINAHKYENIKKNRLFLGSDKPRKIFFPLITSGLVSNL